MKLYLVLILVAILAAIYLGNCYNRLLTRRANLRSVFSRLDQELRAKYDLVIKVTEECRLCFPLENQIATEMSDSRHAASAACRNALSDLGKPGAIDKLSAADCELDHILSRISDLPKTAGSSSPPTPLDLAIAEALEGTSRIASLRQSYNEESRSYNEERERFPALLFATIMRLGPASPWVSPALIKESSPVPLHA